MKKKIKKCCGLVEVRALGKTFNYLCLEPALYKPQRKQ